MNKDFGIRWTEFDKSEKIVTKEKVFSNQTELDSFVKKLEKKNNFNQITSYLIPDEKKIATELLKIAKLLYSDEENFGIKNDGWDKNDLSGLIELLNKFERVQYELKNARRGAYGIRGDTLQDLVNTLNSLMEKLENEISNIEHFIK